MPAAADTVRSMLASHFEPSPDISSDLDCFDWLLPGDGPAPSQGEKGARGTGQGCRQQAFARTLGFGKPAIYLCPAERITAVDLSPAVWSRKVSYGG